MVQVYGDVGGDESSPVMAAACYLGRDDAWWAASAAWTAALRDAGVSPFDATDFYTCHGEFAGWNLNDDRHHEFAKRFRSIAPRGGARRLRLRDALGSVHHRARTCTAARAAAMHPGRSEDIRSVSGR
jgi:hypothetical protein